MNVSRSSISSKIIHRTRRRDGADVLGEGVDGSVPDQTADLSENHLVRTPPKVKKVKGNRSSTSRARAGMMRRRQRTTTQADTVTMIPHTIINSVLVR
jgi:hypothetical protein